MLAITGVLLSAWGWAQQSVPSVDQLLDKHVEAVGGAEKYASISTWYEKREVTGDLTDYVPAGRAPTPFKSHGVTEYFFKAPNLRITSLRSDRNDFVAESGCDGKMSWSYSPRMGMRKEKPTAGHEYACRLGMSPFPIVLRLEKAKLELKGQKEVAGRITFVIRAQVPDHPGENLYYLDSENYMLLRVDSRRGPMHATTLYSDYRDVAGIKVAFQIEVHTENTDQVTKLQDVQVNVPIDDQVFLRPNW
jgi:outer membrane lipoprotein-sorting protein